MKGLIFHSDRGVQYAAKAYRERLEAYGIRQSMSRRGDPYDNAVTENFFSCLKCKLIHLAHYPTRAKAQTDVFAYCMAGGMMGGSGGFSAAQNLFAAGQQQAAQQPASAGWTCSCGRAGNTSKFC